MEKFNPNNPEYKSTNDLPTEQRENYVDLSGGGFIDKSAWEAEQQRKDLAKQRNQARPWIKKVTFQDKASALEIAHEQAIEENLENFEQPDGWVTVDGSPREIIELLQKDLVSRATEKGIRVDYRTAKDFTNWDKADSEYGGYFNVRKAFLKLFNNGLKKDHPMEDLAECNFRLSEVPKSFLKEGYEMSEAFELAPFLQPRYQKDGLPGKYALKFVMFIKKPKGAHVTEGTLRFIDIKIVPYSKTKAKARVEADARKIKRLSREQWANAKRKGLWRAENRNSGDTFKE